MDTTKCLPSNESSDMEKAEIDTGNPSVGLRERLSSKTQRFPSTPQG